MSSAVIPPKRIKKAFAGICDVYIFIMPVFVNRHYYHSGFSPIVTALRSAVDIQTLIQNLKVAT